MDPDSSLQCAGPGSACSTGPLEKETLEDLSEDRKVTKDHSDSDDTFPTRQALRYGKELAAG